MLKGSAFHRPLKNHCKNVFGPAESLMLAALIADRAACLACRLAGCLALSAAAFLQSLLKILCIQALNMFHHKVLLPDLCEQYTTVVSITQDELFSNFLLRALCLKHDFEDRCKRCKGCSEINTRLPGIPGLRICCPYGRSAR